MTTIHRMVLCIVDPEGFPKSQIADAVSRVGDLYPRIVSHDVMQTDWNDDHVLNMPLSADDFDTWFYLNRPSTPTVQTAISTIYVAPHDVAGKAWLLKEVVPLLRQRHLSTALARIVKYPSVSTGEGGRPVLVRLVAEMISQIITAQEA